jgi:Carboxypeptidase regulatory-like domain
MYSHITDGGTPRPLRLIWLVALLAAAAGCGSSDRIGVTGRVTHRDGSPLVGARVTFRSPQTGKTASGFTDQDGNYELGTTTPGEGIPPGGYYVTVLEDRGPIENRKPPTVNEKYTLPDLSGLLFKVEPAGARTFDIVVDPP